MSPRHLLSSSVLRTRGRRLLTAAVLAGTVLGSTVAVAGPASAATTTRTTHELGMGRSVANALNAERRAHGLKPLAINSKLRLSARWHNLTMAKYNELSHQLPGEAFFATRIYRAGYHWSWAGENIGWTSRITKAGVVALEKAMYAERPPNDGHRLNILSRHFRSVGIDIYVDHAHHKVWLTTDFGRRG